MQIVAALVVVLVLLCRWLLNLSAMSSVLLLLALSSLVLLYGAWPFIKVWCRGANIYPGPTPSLFFGNMEEILDKGVHYCHLDWIKTYGPVVRCYAGTYAMFRFTTCCHVNCYSVA